MARSDKGMLFFYDWKGTFEELPGNECKALLLAMLDFCQNDIEPPKFKGKSSIAASFIFSFLKRSKQNANAGRKGMNSRYGDSDNELTNCNFVNNEDITPLGNNNKNNNDNNNDNKKTEKKSGAGDNAIRFTDFWEAYPKKVGKQEAEKAFRKAFPVGDEHNVTIPAIERHKRSAQWTKDGGQFIPNPATWLNQKRWEDELTPATAAPSPANSTFDDSAFEAAVQRTLRLHASRDQA